MYICTYVRVYPCVFFSPKPRRKQRCIWTLGLCLSSSPTLDGSARGEDSRSPSVHVRRHLQRALGQPMLGYLVIWPFLQVGDPFWGALTICVFMYVYIYICVTKPGYLGSLLGPLMFGNFHMTWCCSFYVSAKVLLMGYQSPAMSPSKYADHLFCRLLYFKAL